MKRIAFLTLLICASCLKPQDQLIGTLSDPSVELMAHCFRYVGEYDGWRYGLYNAGYETTVEHPKNLDIDLKFVPEGYSTDSRHLNPNEGRSNIAIERIVL